MARHEDAEIVSMLMEMNIHGFDGEGGTDKGTDHKYTEVYARLLAKCRNLPINFMEIGVWHGGSAALWCKYLPNAKFVFMDIANNIKAKAQALIDHDRSRFYFQSAYDKLAVAYVYEQMPDGLDFAIDDGPHTLDSMIQFLMLYAPVMKAGGTMVIEDIQDASWFMKLQKFVPKGSSIELWDASRETKRQDDIMLIVHI
jgi:predicted O-methyltransferase YrrM